MNLTDEIKDREKGFELFKRIASEVIDEQWHRRNQHPLLSLIVNKKGDIKSLSDEELKREGQELAERRSWVNAELSKRSRINLKSKNFEWVQQQVVNYLKEHDGSRKNLMVKNIVPYIKEIKGCPYAESTLTRNVYKALKVEKIVALAEQKRKEYERNNLDRS